MGRFDARASQAAAFVTTYTTDLLNREAAIGTSGLTGAQPANAFARDVTAFGFSVAVLLDSTGHALAISPVNPKVIGVNLSARYAHLAAGIAGRPTVSDQVAAAANGSPVVGFAAPFNTPFGRRVFSGGFAVGDTPLGAYLDDMLATPGARAYLQDGEGHVLAGNQPVRAELKAIPPSADTTTLSMADAALARALTEQADGLYVHRGAQTVYASARVPHTRWRVVLVVDRNTILVGTGGYQRWLPWFFLLGLSLASAIALCANSRLSTRRRELTELNTELAVAANQDPLTGLANRRLGIARLSVAQTSACGMLLIDIDHFKTVNDTHGHATGDEVIICVAQALRSSLRGADTLSRWGGEEFLAILPGADLAEAQLVARRALDRVVELTSSAVGIPRVTVSIGCAASTVEEPLNSDELILRADEALYHAKASGRAAVRASPRDPHPDPTSVRHVS